MHFWQLLFFIFCFVYKIESVKIQPNFDEIFGDGWDKNESEQTVKIEQNQQNEHLEFIHFHQQNSDEMGNEQIEQVANWGDHNIHKNDQNDKNKEIDQQKREIIKKFDAIKEKLREKRKFEWKKQSKIERKIAQLLGTNKRVIHKWKNELNLNKTKIKKRIYEQKKRKFVERIGEFKGLYGQRKQKQFVKELGISEVTFRKWKKELVPNYHKTQHTNVIYFKVAIAMLQQNGDEMENDPIDQMVIWND